MQKIFLFLCFIALSAGTAKAQSFDNISKQYPIDAEHFAYEASLEMAKKYPFATNFALVTAKKRDIFIDKFASFLKKDGFIIGQNPTVTIHYTLDYIDEDRALLNLTASDGVDIGIVRNLGEITSPTITSKTDLNTQYAEYGERKNSVGEALMYSSNTLDTYGMEASNSSVNLDAYQNYTPIWQIQKGSLMHQLEDFAKAESWDLIWSASFDLEMKADATFEGSFVEFVEKLFSSLQNTKSGLRVSIYKANNVLEVLGE